MALPKLLPCIVLLAVVVPTATANFSARCEQRGEGDSWEDATRLEPGQSCHGSLESEDLVDWYRIDVPLGASSFRLSFCVEGASEAAVPIKEFIAYRTATNAPVKPNFFEHTYPMQVGGECINVTFGTGTFNLGGAWVIGYENVDALALVDYTLELQ